MTWSVYIISCSDGSFYTGITTDVTRRFQQHQQGKGAKYFRSHQPSEIVFIESGHCRSSASQREIMIKKLKHHDKRRLIAAHQIQGAAPAKHDPIEPPQPSVFIDHQRTR